MEDGRSLEIFSRRRGAGKNEDSRADIRADAERSQRPRAESFLQLLAGELQIRKSAYRSTCSKKADCRWFLRLRYEPMTCELFRLVP